MLKAIIDFDSKASKKLTYLLLIVAFIEGASLMSVELISSRIIATGFGASVQVWAIILSATLFGLSTGYYFGGKLSKQQNKRIFYILIFLLVSSILMNKFTEIGFFLNDFFIGFSLLGGTILTCLLIIFPTLFLFGAISPLVIDVIAANEIDFSGSSAGIVYGISTFGGILATFLFGLYFIPHLGLKTSSLIVSFALFFAILLILFLAFFFKKERN